MKRSVALTAALGVLAACGAGCQFGAREEAAPQALPIAQARRGEFRVTVDEVGVVRARTSTAVRAPFHGKVLRVVDEGTAVAVGDPVLVLDATEEERELEGLVADEMSARSELEKHLERLDLQRRRQRLDLARSEANVRFEESKLASAKKAEEDARRQRELGLISEEALERASQARESAELSRETARLSHARSLEELKSEESQIQFSREEASRRSVEVGRRRLELQKEVDSAIVKAPTSGVAFHPKVFVRGSREPRKIRVGDQVGRWSGAIVEIPDPSSVEIRSQVDEALLGRVTPGLQATVRVTALDALRLPARVLTVGGLAIERSTSEGAGFADRRGPESEQVVFPITLELLERDARLQPGMTVAVSYVLTTLPDVVFVPEDAVFGAHAEPIVFVVKDGGWQERRVQLGPSSGGRVVVSDGLSGDETLYLGDPRQARAEPIRRAGAA